MISTPSGQYAGAQARQTLHEQLLHSIIQKSIYFFQVTPFGRLMNRFSSDMAVIDKVPFDFYLFWSFQYPIFVVVIWRLTWGFFSTENRGNKSKTSSIHFALFVCHFIERNYYAMVHRPDAANLWHLLCSTKRLLLFVKVNIPSVNAWMNYILLIFRSLVQMDQYTKKRRKAQFSILYRTFLIRHILWIHRTIFLNSIRFCLSFLLFLDLKNVFWTIWTDLKWLWKR